jgi:hypothetical protein
MDRAQNPAIGELLKKAEQYRRVARGPVPWDVAQSLEKWAEDCEREAAERMASAQPPKAA